MTVWTSVLWNMNIHMAKKWPEMVVTLSFISIFHFRSDYNNSFLGSVCSVLLGSDLESGIGWPEPACMYHRYGHKALEYFIQFRSDLEKREKNHSVYIKSISSFNSLMHLLLKSSALILLMTALLKPWTFSWSADDASLILSSSRKYSKKTFSKVHISRNTNIQFCWYTIIFPWLQPRQYWWF